MDAKGIICSSVPLYANSGFLGAKSIHVCVHMCASVRTHIYTHAHKIHVNTEEKIH